MTATNATTVHELLMSCPDDQIVRLQNAWKDAAAGDWTGAAHWLRNAAKDGDTAWHDECAVLAVELDNTNRPRAGMTRLEEYAAEKIIGRGAHDNGFPMASNPHPDGSEMAMMWQCGFISGMDAAMVAKRAVRTA